MITFDRILPITIEVLRTHRDVIARLEWLLVNRDLNGRVRLILPDSAASDTDLEQQLKAVYGELAERIKPHAHSTEAGLLYEASRDGACHGTSAFPLGDIEKVWVIDRLATESRWETIAEVSSGAPRIVFFSIKGGVGRSTALAASAWSLAMQGKRVLVLDLDLESPGLSSALLPPDRQPAYGITDWLVEDLVDNGDALLADMYGTSDLPTSGSIYLVPAHGRAMGEYVSKLGRCWMPKRNHRGAPESWSVRLNRLVEHLESLHRPDVILIDSRAGIDEVAAACVTDLGAHTVLMFAIQGQQTWTGYQALFSYWMQRGVITDIRNRLQLVAGLVPDDERRLEYLTALRGDSYALFEDTYDEVEPGEISHWNFEEDDDVAPHSPLAIRWNRGWYGMMSLQQRMVHVDQTEVTSAFGMLLDFLDRAVGQGRPT
ncbi:ParA family protein [Azospirillum halopraeferens]|uniref:ParA family protein n=1 Tax=Azospirillum halopraeferens TaxID=34010 RepID=UPI00041C631B|nr:ArsA-related P-loop ATPase [Azospirillum halopraeferens]